MNVYDTDVKDLICSCEDWKQTRRECPIDDPRRLCKHIINQFDTSSLPSNLKYFKEDIEFYKQKEKGFNKQFKKIIRLLDEKYIALYNDDDWTNVYNEDGENFALIITSFNDDFKWANDKKPKDFKEIEIFFDKDEYLPAIGLFSDEKELIIKKMRERYSRVSFDGSTDFVITAKSIFYSLVDEKDENNDVYVTNEIISISPYIKFTITRDKEKVDEALAKRKQLRKKIIAT